MFSQLAFWKTYFTPDRYSIAQIPDLTGKVAIVTGANTGLGYTTMVALAGRGAHVFLACRSQKRAIAAIETALLEIRSKYPLLTTAPKLEFLELDLMDINKTQQAAKEFLRKGLPLHILVCNAGIQVVPFELSADGIEAIFAVNHIGHFVFTIALLDRLKTSQPSRVVMISSIAHEAFPPRVGIDFDTLNDPTKSTDLSRYGRSKLANVLFAKALARRVANDNVYVNACHPGFIPRFLEPQDDTWKEWFDCIVKNAVTLTAERAALTQLYLATSPEIEERDVRGKYFIPVANEIEPAALARNERLQEELWAFSEDIVREKVKA
ncbi:NAD(P)-binding protein [Linnemannia elongata AG-77]|uniref:NAD(P)-binding protein n=1 Tax=Linnemannia elongata AG-77 TaxID=1314771 RepID=A0A197K6P1_9FUNG|nr:NAD(P)-binding protein [Linnemannia elongata AG-77]